jgi:hypothetical protein
MRITALLGLCFGALVGCATYHDDLERGQHYYEVSQFPNALAVWRTLEFDLDSLSYAEQARYSYLRGMTDYRMGFRADARHWLAVSRAIEQKHPGGLDAKSSSELEKVLSELNAAVYAMGPPPSATATGMELKNVTPGMAANNEAQGPVLASAPAAVPAAAAPAPVKAAPTPAPMAVPVAPAKAPAPVVAPAPAKPPTQAPPANTGAPSVPAPSNVPPPSGF